MIDSIAQVAMGKIGPAANYIEQSIAKAIPVIISFLARLIGLGGISKKIQDIIKKIRAPIDKAIDKVLDWIVAKGKALWGKISGKGKQGAPLTPEEHDRQVKAGLAEIQKQVVIYDDDHDKMLTFEEAEKVLAKIKTKYPVFKVLKVVDASSNWNYEYEASPGSSGKISSKKLPNTADWELRNSKGQIKIRGHEISGGSTPGRRLSFPEQQKVHTEGKILTKIEGNTQPGDILTIRGREKPCPMCGPALKRAANRLEIRIIYMDVTGKKHTYP